MTHNSEINHNVSTVQSKIIQYKTNESLNHKGELVQTPYEIPNRTRGYLIEKKDTQNQIRDYIVIFKRPLEISKHVYIYQQNFKTLNDVYEVYESVVNP